VDGKSVLHGVGAPDDGSVGTDGDFYLDTFSSTLYGPKTGGAWGSGISLIGPEGPQGQTGADGPEGPQGPQGIPGTSGMIDSICVDSHGSPGFVVNGVCVLDYDATSTSTWTTAVASCIASGGDLCAASQYDSIRNPENAPDLFHNARPVWSNDFSDNDGGIKTFTLHSNDDPTATLQYSFGCCLRLTPEPYRSQAETIGGVLVTYLHSRQDTTWKAANRICHMRGADLCSKSQYVALNDAGRFSGNDRRATHELSDNDAGLLSSVVGGNTADNPSWDQPWSFACCGSTRPLDHSCPGTELANGLCVMAIHDSEDTNFPDAALACTGMGADICSKSQMQALRDAGQFSGKSWSNDGADNDSNRAGGLLKTQPDNPNPSTDLMGYACCL